MRSNALFLLVAVALTGCLQSSSPSDSSNQAVPEPEPEPDLGSPGFGASVLVDRAGDGYGIGGEPSVAVAPDGTIYVTAPMIPAESLATTVAGPGQHGRAWRSDDGGRTFTLLNRDDGRLTDEGYGNGDTDVAVDGSGRVHVVDLGGGIPYRYSADRGETWTWGGVLNDEGQPVDRQWIDATPDGFLAATWAAQDGEPRAITFTASADGGRTWSEPRNIVDGMIQLGPVEVAPDGRTVYQPYVRDNGHSLNVLVSRDRGETWADRETGRILPVPVEPLQNPWSPTVIFPVVSVDAGGAVWLTWSEYGEGGGAAVHWSRSVDGGETWSEPEALSGPSRTSVLPWVVAGDEGRAAIVYLLSDQGGDPNQGLHEWRVAATFLTKTPRQDGEVALTVSDAVVHRGAVCPNGGGCTARVLPVRDDRSLLDFFEAALTPDGDLVVVWTQTDDLEGRNPQVRFARQNAGLRLA